MDEYRNIELSNNGVNINYDYLWVIDDIVEIESKLFHSKNKNFVKGMHIKSYLLSFTAYARCMPTELEWYIEPKRIRSIEIS